MSDNVIQVENLYKVYYPGKKLKENFTDKLNNIFLRKKETKAMEIIALNNLTFNVKQGEVLGIIGDNGSGKSTLLKIISGITEPTSGVVKVKGRVASILEVGTGFHPELTGRENIYFTGGIYGFSEVEMKKREDQIIDFSGLQEYIDVPVKFYSSGMFMRLAFSVVAMQDADIILLDEVFSVGDIKFKEKCEKRIFELHQLGKTILFISHDISAVSKICSNFIVLEKGVLHKTSDNLSAIFNYISSQYTDQTPTNQMNHKSFQIDLIENEEFYSAKIYDFKNEFIEEPITVKCYAENNSSKLLSTKDLNIQFTYKQIKNHKIIPSLNLNYQYATSACALSPLISDMDIENKLDETGVKIFQCKIRKLTLNNGIFSLGIVFSDIESKLILSFEKILTFKVEYDNVMLKKYTYDGKFFGPFVMKTEWKQITKS